ncbi:unnamed protein product [Caenorhabditis auriculariae]|uniref:GH18 domain-containing protein n=1 Tax=Caenorhabditis auriculariae TaxID=2777116 RepID=A0A8S1GZ17_9PELO|nr:unnamed protein product [Caenorhabditis auriculariae]
MALNRGYEEEDGVSSSGLISVPSEPTIEDDLLIDEAPPEIWRVANGSTTQSPESLGHCHGWVDDSGVEEDLPQQVQMAIIVTALNKEKSSTAMSEPPEEEVDLKSRTYSWSSHCHEHIDPHEKHIKGRKAERVLWAVAALSAVFIAAEFAGGFFASSLAIMTDAGHMLSDLLSFLISIFAIRCARQPASKRLSFGYERAEVLGAMTSILILWVLTTVLVLLAIERIVNGNHVINADMMLITAGAGVLFNIVMGLVLHFGTGGHGHTHGGSHGHSHGGDAGKNVNVRAALIHVIGDLVQSIGVLAAALIIKFTGWTIADPICTFLFSLIVLFTTVTVLKDIFFVLMEATPSHFDLKAVKDALSELDGVKGVHDLHLWSIGMDKTAFSVHLALDSQDRAMETVAKARALIRMKFGVAVATVQVEPFDVGIDSCAELISDFIGKQAMKSVFSTLLVFFSMFATSSSSLSIFYIAKVPTDICTHIALIGSTFVGSSGQFVPPPSFVSTSFLSLKRRNSALKLLLCLTGPNPNFSLLVSSEETIERFVTDSHDFLTENELDGMDIDWEFPTWSADAQPTDKQRFSTLLRQLRSRYGKKLLLTVAVSGPPTITKLAYDVEALERYADLVNVMNYDFHIFSPKLPFVGFNAPLRHFRAEMSVLGLMNSEASMATYAKLGLSANKTLFGVPTYARGYRLLTRFLHRPFSPAVATDDRFTNYAAVCQLEKNRNYQKRWNSRAASPYLYGKDKLWLSYETMRSLSQKVRFARSLGVAGIMVYDIGSDDVGGECGLGPFPLLNSILNSTKTGQIL